MGLDTVELVMEIEDTFAIRIPDKDASEIQTAGQLCDYIVQTLKLQERLHPRPSYVCPTATAFYRLRAAILQTIPHVARPQLRPSSPIASVIPFSTRAAVCDAFTRLSGLRIELMPRSLLSSAFTPVWLLVLCAAIVLAATDHLGVLALFAILLSPLVLLPLIVILRHLWPISMIRIFPSADTLGDLARHATQNAPAYRAFPAINKTWSPSDIWPTVTQLIAEQMGIPPSHVHRSSHFINDLGMG